MKEQISLFSAPISVLWFLFFLVGPRLQPIREDINVPREGDDESADIRISSAAALACWRPADIFLHPGRTGTLMIPRLLFLISIFT
jgi:hypothetical protein